MQVIEKKYSKADFKYLHYKINREFMNTADESSVLYAVYELFNSDEFLTSMREFTGDETINYVDCRATCFNSGHYLRRHNDYLEGFNRRYAYVLNLTKDWEPDWGGILHLLNNKKEITQSLIPKFNVLNVFKVPTPHFVSSVSPDVESSRLAITGWLYALDKPDGEQGNHSHLQIKDVNE